jgi:DNA-binding HxlR family transcriptional regulator
MPPQKPACPIHEVIEVFARPWVLHILYALSTQGPARFSQLKSRIEGISARLLAERLRLLEKQGFVYRDYEQTIPPTVTYGITHRMKDVERVLAELERVARKWQDPATVTGGSRERHASAAK